MSVWAAIALFTSGAIPSAARAQGGIAARYPGDKNIGSDPAVILADDFESYTSTSQLTTKWSGAYQMANLRIASETDNYYAGLKALEMKLPISSSEVSNALKKKLIPEQDTVFIRSYQKWDSGYLVTGSNHNGLRLSGKYPGRELRRQQMAQASSCSCCKTTSKARRWQERARRGMRISTLTGRNRTQPSAIIGIRPAQSNLLAASGSPLPRSIQTSRRCRISCRSADAGIAMS